MRKILTSRLFRCLICLILVCSLLVLSSPIRAQAVLTEAATGFVVVGGIVCIAAIFQALGVLPGAEPIHFNDKVNECFEYIKNTTSYVVNGGFQVLGTIAALETGILSYLPRDLIQSVWEWTFDSGLVKEVPITQHIQQYDHYTSFQNKLPLYLNYAWCVAVFYPDSWAICYSNADCKFYFQDPHYYFTSDSGFTIKFPDLPLRDAKITSFDPTRYVSLSVYHNGVLQNDLHDVVYGADGLILGQIQSPYQSVGTDEEKITIEIAPIYVDWATGEVSQSPPGSDDDNGSSKPPIPYWPVGIPSTDYSDILQQDQEQAQSGQTDLEFEPLPDSNPDPGTNPDVDPNPGTNSGSSSWQPPSDPTQFQLVDLTKFFPFCIPFDLFEFFKLLNSDPVAPVLHWEIQDLAGQTYSLTVDLSAWDSVALLFRRLQLFLFVTGLAAASRKFIKW